MSLDRAGLLGLLLFITAACGPSEAPGPARAAAPAPPERDPAVAPPAREARPRIVFLGTSLTAGFGLNREQAYPALIQAKLDSAGLAAEVVNAGVSGETSAGGLRRIDWLLREPVDVLVLELGANDGLRGQDPEAMRANLQEIVERTRARYPEAALVIVGMEAPPNLGERYTQRFREVFVELAREHDAALVPFLLEGVAAVPRLNQPDGIHPTAEGQRLAAATVWAVLEPVVRTRLAQPAGALR
jgi:acyl-CoA thioesterase I